MNNKEMIDNLIAALKSFTENPDNLENFESYINRHSDIWFKKYASTPHRIPRGPITHILESGKRAVISARKHRLGQ